MGRNGNAVPDMGGGHMSESLYDFCRKYDPAVFTGGMGQREKSPSDAGWGDPR